MPDRFSSAGDGESLKLKRRLRREAGLTRPAFSESIHDRLRRSVGERRDALAPRRSSHRPQGLRAWLAAAVLIAASLVLGIVWQAYRLCSPDIAPRDLATARPQPVSTSSDLDQLAGFTDSAASRLDVLVHSALSGQRWAYLDQDAQSALGMLADRVPVDVRFLIGLPDQHSEPEADLAHSD